MGKILASETPPEGQVIVATHSQDFLQGLLESPTRQIKIVRIARNATKEVEVLSLEPDRVRALWSDALIRYSNLLDGLFHPGVVICESDSDCRFYSATADVLNAGGPDHDLLFTHVGGKTRIPKALQELAKFGVRCCALADLDLLNDENFVRSTVEAAGGSWSDFESDLKIIGSAVGNLGSLPLVGRVLDDIQDSFKDQRARLMTRNDANKISTIAKVSTGWEQLKRSGISAVPQGDASQAIKKVISGLADIGIFLVPVGELERWHFEISGKSSSWVSAVLERGLHENPDDQLRTFLTGILRYLT